MPSVLKKYHTREDGFTLVELLIVVLIIGILAAIAIPVYLGIQNQGYKSVVKADVNQSVKRVQVALTEGAAIADVKANYVDYGVKASQPKNGETVYLANSPSAGASSSRDYQVVGSMDRNATPNAAPINYTYTYDSYTGKFGEADTASSTPQIVLGSGTGTLPDGYTGATYTGQIDATVTGGTGTTQYTITGGSLPTGYSLDQATGAITGNTATAGTYPVTVTVTNGSLSNSRPYVLRVYTKPVINTSNLPAGTVGTAYSQTLDFVGNPTPTFALSSGSLPAGLNLDTGTGKISGTPTTNGSSTFTVTATNSGGSDAKSYTIAIGTAPTIAASNSAATTIWPAFSQIKYTPSEQPVATGYPSPTFSATNLPSGLSINSSTGVISGIPATAGTYSNIALSATNAYGTSTKTVSMNVLTGTNTYSQVVDWVRSDSVGTVNFYGWAFAQGGSDNTKANLRVDVYIDSTNYDFYSTDWARPDVNNAYGGNIGNYHGYNITLNATSGSHNMRIYLRDSNSAAGSTKVYDGTVVVK